MNGIADGSCLHHLNYLLEFLAAWENRPACLTPMAYQWCSDISEVAGRLGPSEITIGLPDTLQVILEDQLRLRPQDLTNLPLTSEAGFSEVGPGHDPARLDPTSHHTCGRPQRLTPPMYTHLLFITLDIGFRYVTPSRDQSALHLDHTSHHKWVFETAFSSDDDGVIADAMYAWIVSGYSAPPGSCAHYLAKWVERDRPFSPRLRLASIHIVEHIWRNETKGPGLDTVHWLNRLNINVDDMVDKYSWVKLLVEAIRSPTEPVGLTSHYWRLLDKLVVASKLGLRLGLRNMEVMRSLEKAEDWERLGVWMVVVWSFLPYSDIPTSESMESIEEVTLKSLLRRPSALRGFEDLCEAGRLSYQFADYPVCKDKLQRICDQVRVKQLPLESPLP